MNRSIAKRMILAALSWQQPLFMFLIYYLPLKRKSNEMLDISGNV